MLRLSLKIAIVCCLSLGFGCRQNSELTQAVFSPADDRERLIFQTGFESDVKGSPAHSFESLSGKDNSKTELSDFDQICNHPTVGMFDIYYQGGTPEERFARFAQDPASPENRVLHFMLKTANVKEEGKRTRGRVMTRIERGEGLRELYSSVRLYLSDDFEVLKQWNTTFDWLMLFEFWNNPNWGPNLRDPFRFRMKVDISKPDPTPGTDLFFRIMGQDMNDFGKVWTVAATHFPIPTETWMTIEIYIKEGDNKTGRFYMSVTPENQSKIVLCDESAFTHHPDNPSPKGVSHYQPMKLYTSAKLLEFTANNGKSLNVFWDDWELWTNKLPN